MVRVYIAGSHQYHRIALQLEEELDVDVVSTWYHLPIGYCIDGLSNEEKAIKDCVEIAGSDLVVVIANPGSGGGFHNELGYAMGLGKPVLSFGEERGMLGFHPAIEHYDSWEALNAAIPRTLDGVYKMTRRFRAKMAQKHKAVRCECGRLTLVAVNAELTSCVQCRSTITS